MHWIVCFDLNACPFLQFLAIIAVHLYYIVIEYVHAYIGYMCLQEYGPDADHCRRYAISSFMLC